MEDQGIKVKSGSNDARDCEAVKEYVQKCRLRIGELRTGIASLEADEKYQVQQDIEAVYEEAIRYVTEKLKNYYC